jgi:hypothetical protein
MKYLTEEKLFFVTFEVIPYDDDGLCFYLCSQIYDYSHKLINRLH